VRDMEEREERGDKEEEEDDTEEEEEEGVENVITLNSPGISLIPSIRVAVRRPMTNRRSMPGLSTRLFSTRSSSFSSASLTLKKISVRLSANERKQNNRGREMEGE
jgi:hypothetical protein